MALPLFFPPVRYVKCIDASHAVSIELLCQMADTRCEAFGPWTQRPVVLRDAMNTSPSMEAEPGDWGTVQICAPYPKEKIRQARWALGALAFVLFDGVARATVAGKTWAKIERLRGRSKDARRPRNIAERQERFRSRARIRPVVP